MQRRTFVTLCLTASALAACQEITPDVAPAQIVVSARVASAVIRALPPGAVMILELADVSLADAPAIRIAKERLAPAPQVALTVPSGRLRDGMTYALSLRIEGPDGTLLYVTDTLHRLPPNPPRQVNLGRLSVVPIAR